MRFRNRVNLKAIGSRIYIWAIILLPLLHQYRLLPLEYLDFISLLFLVPALIHFLGGEGVNTRFFPFYLYCVLSVFVSGLFFYSSSPEKVLLSAARIVTIYITVFAYGDSVFDYNYGTRIYKGLAVSLSVVVIVQYAVYLLFGVPTFLLIPGVELNYAGGMNSVELIERLHNSVSGGYIYRPTALFIEPADFAYFIIPALIIALFSNKEKNNKTWFVLPIIMTSAAVLTTSTMAIITCFIVWGFYLFSIKGKNKIVLICLMPLIVIGVLLSQEGVLQSISRKIMQLQQMNFDSGSSTSLRLLRGLVYFLNMEFPIHIVGCGFGKLVEYYRLINMNLAMDVNLSNVGYMNSVFIILCSEGILGAILYFSSFFKFIIKEKDRIVNLQAIILLFMMFGGAIIDSGAYYVIMVLLFSRTKLLQRNNQLTILAE